MKAVTDRSPSTAQGLGPALRFLARDRNLQITYASEEIGERRTQGAVGELPVASAASPSSEEDSEESEETDEPDEPSWNTAQGVRPEAAFEPAPLPQVTIEAERQALRKRIAASEENGPSLLEVVTNGAASEPIEVLVE